MKLKNKTTYYIFPHLTVSILLHWLMMIFFIAAIVICYKYYQNALVAVIIVFLIVFILSFLLLNVFFWNAIIKVEAAGMTQRHGFHKCVWIWEEITDVKCRTHRPWPLNTSEGAMYSPKFIFISSKYKRGLSIVMEKHTRDVFFKMCSNEELKKKCYLLLDSCDFLYYGKNNKR